MCIKSGEFMILSKDISILNYIMVLAAMQVGYYKFKEDTFK